MATPAAPNELVVIRFGTPLPEANARAVASTIQAVLALVDGAKESLGAEHTLVVKARPFKPGSLEIPLEFYLVGFALLFPDNPLIQEILRVLKEYIEARKEAKGQPLPIPTDSKGNITIGPINNSAVTLNLINNSEISFAVDQAAADIQADETIEEVTVLTGENRETLVTIPRSELPYLRYDPNVPAVEGQSRKRTTKTTLVIHTPVLEGRGKWKFIYKEQTIAAEVQDADFMNRVSASQEAFAAGDRLEVDLEVTKEYDASLATDCVKDYVVVKVHKHTKKPKQKVLSLRAEPVKREPKAKKTKPKRKKGKR